MEIFFRFLDPQFSNAYQFNELGDYQRSIQRSFALISLIPAGFTYFIFIYWDSFLAGGITVTSTALRSTFFIISIGFFVWLLQEKQPTTLDQLILSHAIYASISLEYIYYSIDNTYKLGVAGNLMVMFWAGLGFHLSTRCIIILGILILVARSVHLYLVGAEIEYWFSDIYILFASLMLCILISAAIKTHERNNYQVSTKLRDEKQKNDNLIREILPEFVLDKLGQSKGKIAESKNEVSVIFADLMQFTKLTQSLSPGHLVDLLSELFSYYDNAAREHGITKIKTIGDAYMAACGVHEEGPPTAINAIKFSEQISLWTKEYGKKNGLDLQLRIGIATGSVVTGVLGTSKPNFDVWGETVNLASRLQTSCLGDEVLISEATYWRVRSEFGELASREIELHNMGIAKVFSVQAV